jgi:tetratricopeptide (TPR) repeat protein/predicted Ser/Thr protein kinase
MGAESFEDLISIAARQGLLDEATARGRLQGKDPDPHVLIESGLLTPEQVRTLVAPSSPAQASRASVAQIPHEAARAGEDPARQFGRYVLVERIGQGGMGEVWKAWQKDLGRWVALKFVRGDDPEDVGRFVREAQTAAKLSHANIVATYEAGETGGRHFISMEYIDGDDLKKLRLEPRRAMELIMLAAEAVQFAHEQGIIHRDLKPHNLMVTDRGRLYVMDFGLAKSMSAPSGLTLSGTIAGTPQYMAPEQARAEPADARSDVYALGATLYELVTGSPPFEGKSVAELLRKVLEAEPTPPRRLNARLDRDIETIVMKCLEKDPGRRYADARALAEDIGRWLDGEPLAARPVPMIARLWRKAVKRRAVVIPMAAVVVVAIVVGTISIRAALVEREKKATAERRDRGVKDALALLNAANDLVYDGTATPAQLHAAARRVLDKANDLLNEFPNESELYLYRGKAHRLLGDDALAQPDFLKAVALDAGNGSAHYELGWMNLEHAVSSLTRRVHQRMPRIEEVRNSWLEKVEARFEAAERSRGLTEQERTMVRLWKLYFEQNAEAQASIRKECDRQIEMGGRVESFYFLRGILGGEPAGELGDYTQAVQRAPNNPLYRQFRGWKKMDLEDWRGASDDFSRAIEIKKGNAVAYHERGWTKGNLGDYKGAMEDFEQAIEINRNFVEAYSARGWAKGELGDHKGAIEDYTRAIEIDKNFAEAYRRRGAAKANLKDWNAAIDDYTLAIEIKKDFAGAYHYRGWAKGNSGDYKGAMEDFEQAIEIKKDYADPYHGRGWAKGALGDYNGAIEDYTRAIEINKGFAGAYRDRGRARERLADLEKDRAAEQLKLSEEDLMRSLDLGGEAWTWRPDTEGVLRRVREKLANLDP